MRKLSPVKWGTHLKKPLFSGNCAGCHFKTAHDSANLGASPDFPTSAQPREAEQGFNKLNSEHSGVKFQPHWLSICMALGKSLHLSYTSVSPTVKWVLIQVKPFALQWVFRKVSDFHQYTVICKLTCFGYAISIWRQRTGLEDVLTSYLA